jgi:hypothetical protein
MEGSLIPKVFQETLKKIKKTKKKKKVKTYLSIVTNNNYKKKLEQKVDESQEIPDEIKMFIKATELNPYCLIIDPYDKSILKEEYFEFIEGVLSNMILD